MAFASAWKWLGMASVTALAKRVARTQRAGKPHVSGLRRKWAYLNVGMAARWRCVSPRRQGIPCRERIHVVSPARDLAVLDHDDRAEPIVIFGAGRTDCPMDLVFDDDDAVVVCLVDNQLIGGMELD